MKCLLSILLVFVVLALSASCGDIFVRGALNSGTETAAGVVSIVQFSSTNGGTSITVVTLMQSGAANTLTFCGDQRRRFPVDQALHVTFTPGSSCGSVIAIMIG